MSLNGGYAMIKYNSTQEELAIAYKSKRPVLFYDENQRAHWAVIEETATQSVDEETQEPITLYEYSYRLLDEESSGNEVHLYQHDFYLVETSPIHAQVYFTIYTKSANEMTYNDIYNYLNERGFTYVYDNGLSVTGYIKSQSLTEYNAIIKISADINTGNLACIFSPTYGNWYHIDKEKTTVTDTITQIF